MKAHISADRDSQLVHTVANVTRTAELLHGEEQQVHAAAGHTGVEQLALGRTIDWQTRASAA